MTQAEASAILVRLNTAVFALSEALDRADKADDDLIFAKVTQSLKAALQARDAANKLVTRLVERKTE